MIIPLFALLLVLSPALLGGRLRRLAGVRLQHTWLILGTLVVQVVAVELPFGPEWLPSATHVATYAVAGLFVWLNRRIPGLLAIGLGAASNGVTIALNGGRLPASEQALRLAGRLGPTRGFANSGLVEHPRLPFLGDVFAIPASWPLHNVFSVGDLIIVLGAGYASLRICGARGLAPWSDPATPDAAPGRVKGPRHRAPRRSRFTGVTREPVAIPAAAVPASPSPASPVPASEVPAAAIPLQATPPGVEAHPEAPAHVIDR